MIGTERSRNNLAGKAWFSEFASGSNALSVMGKRRVHFPVAHTKETRL